LITEERRKKILELIALEGVVNLQQLTELFGVSIYTIRRDLTYLEQKGSLKKIHGGATRVEKTKWIATIEDGKKEAFEEKKAIALNASKLIDNGDTIMLMGSTISLLIIPLIKDKEVTVVTNSLDVAKELSLISNIETILIGGKIKNYKGNILGSRAVLEASNYFFDKSFIPCAGIDLNFGISTSTTDSADFLKAVIKSSKKNIVVADYRKIGRVTFAKVCNLNDIDLIITDDKASKDTTNKFLNHNIKIDIVSTTK